MRCFSGEQFWDVASYSHRSSAEQTASSSATDQLFCARDPHHLCGVGGWRPIANGTLARVCVAQFASGDLTGGKQALRDGKNLPLKEGRGWRGRWEGTLASPSSCAPAASSLPTIGETRATLPSSSPGCGCVPTPLHTSPAPTVERTPPLRTIPCDLAQYILHLTWRHIQNFRDGRG